MTVRRYPRRRLCSGSAAMTRLLRSWVVIDALALSAHGRRSTVDAGQRRSSASLLSQMHGDWGQFETLD
jgi:hypothetical protein